MSTNFTGWIDFRHTVDDEEWLSFAVLWPLIDGNSDAYGCLFGVRNFARFRPIAAARGLPPGATWEERSGWESDRSTPGVDAYGATWVTAGELAAIDWDELAEGPDQRVHKYQRRADGTLRAHGKAGHYRDLDGIAESVDGHYRGYPEGTEWLVGENIYRIETVSRREALDPFLELALHITSDLADRFGGDNVRWVVWFTD